MEPGSILIILSVMIVVAVFVSRPFLTNRTDGEAELPARDGPERQRSELLAEYERALTALQELDFDNALGKIPVEEYPVQRAELITACAETLTKLDALKKETSTQSVEARLEAAIAARRTDASRQQVALPNGSRSGGVVDREDPLEELIASRRQERAEKSGGFCPHCGKPVQKSDRFCPRCGSTLFN